MEILPNKPLRRRKIRKREGGTRNENENIQLEVLLGNCVDRKPRSSRDISSFCLHIFYLLQDETPLGSLCCLVFA